MSLPVPPALDLAVFCGIVDLSERGCKMNITTVSIPARAREAVESGVDVVILPGQSPHTNYCHVFVQKTRPDIIQYVQRFGWQQRASDDRSIKFFAQKMTADQVQAKFNQFLEGPKPQSSSTVGQVGIIKS